MEHGWGTISREQILENGNLKVPLNLQNRSLTVQGCIRVGVEMRTAWKCKYLKLWKKDRVGDSLSVDC